MVGLSAIEECPSSDILSNLEVPTGYGDNMLRIVCGFFNPGSLSGQTILSDLEFPTENNIESVMETIIHHSMGYRFSSELQHIYPHLSLGGHDTINAYGLPQAHHIASVAPGEHIVCPSTIPHISRTRASNDKGFRFVLLFSDVTIRFDGRFIDLARGDMFACNHLPEMYSREDTFGLLEIYILIKS